MRLQKYDFTVHYERGKNMHLADMLSRAYLPYKGKEVDDFESVNMVGYLPISDQPLEQRPEKTSLCESCQRLFSKGGLNIRMIPQPTTPLLQHARQTDHTRWPGFQRKFCRNTSELSRRHEGEHSLVPPRNRSMSAVCM